MQYLLKKTKQKNPKTHASLKNVPFNVTVSLVAGVV